MPTITQRETREAPHAAGADGAAAAWRLIFPKRTVAHVFTFPTECSKLFQDDPSRRGRLPIDPGDRRYE
jgi:hypothetical protein